MPQLGVEIRAVFRSPSHKSLGNVLQGFQMSSGVPITPRVIGDDGEPMAKEFSEFGMHGLRIIGTGAVGRRKNGFRWGGGYFTVWSSSSAVHSVVLPEWAFRIVFTCSGVTAGAWLPKLERT